MEDYPSKDTSCKDSFCWICCIALYRFFMALLLVFTPFIALTNIIFDIIYFKTHEEVLRYTDLYVIYLVCFFAIPAIGEICGLVQVIDEKPCISDCIILMLMIPIFAWLEMFARLSKQQLRSNRVGITTLTLQYSQCVVSVVQFLIQFYIIGYSNDWNIFLIVKLGMLILQIISAIRDCCEHGCCCCIKSKQQQNFQGNLYDDLLCLGDKLSCLLFD